MVFFNTRVCARNNMCVHVYIYMECVVRALYIYIHIYIYIYMYIYIWNFSTLESVRGLICV